MLCASENTKIIVIFKKFDENMIVNNDILTVNIKDELISLI